MEEGWYFPLDTFVEILLRLPMSARQRFRFVCRFWREVIDTRTTEMQSRPKVLVYGGDPGRTTVSAYVVDDLSEGLARKLWTGGTTGKDLYRPDVTMVGTSKGLLCLCDKSKAGHITLVNPVTGEMLLLPSQVPILGPFVTTMYDPKAYNFTYHPMTGQYKILHVPCRCFSFCDRFDVVYALTPGDATWRAVPTPGASCNLRYGLISIDGTMFWVTADTTNRVIMSLDLEHECLASTKPLPVRNNEIVVQLVEFHGRLGVTTWDNTSVNNTQVGTTTTF
ncbi:unnamed protein product [Alopecurus aequalis]